MTSDSANLSIWPTRTLDQVRAPGRSIVSGPFGSNIGKRFFVDEGIPVIRGNNLSLSMDRFRDDGFVFLTHEKALEFTACEAHACDLIFTAAGTIGQVGLIPLKPRHSKYIISNKQIRVRVDLTQLLPLFAYYWFASPAMVKYIQARNTGSTIPLINLSVVRSLPIPVPPLSVQQEIIEVLGALDDRIALLRETNATLEAIAQALFKSWFVDFDPVRAKSQGLAPAGMDDATAALFPDGFEESAQGPRPKGWASTTVAEVADITKGKSYSSKDLAATHQTALVTLKSFERGGGFRLDGFKPYSGTYKPAQVIRAGDLIVAYTDVTQAAELIGKPAVVVEVDEYSTLVASLDVGIVRPIEQRMTKQFLYGLFKTPEFQAHTLAHTSGTTVLHLSKDAVGSFAFSCPTLGPVVAFSEVADAIAERRQLNIDQMRNLVTLRDILLPRLMSGQLRMPSLESHLAKAAT